MRVTKIRNLIHDWATMKIFEYCEIEPKEDAGPSQKYYDHYLEEEIELWRFIRLLCMADHFVSEHCLILMIFLINSLSTSRYDSLSYFCSWSDFALLLALLWVWSAVFRFVRLCELMLLPEDIVCGALFYQFEHNELF